MAAPAPRPRLDASALDRAAGVLLGAAAGDALGVPYEFQATLTEEQRPEMIGGGLGPYEPGEYSDDTQMQVCIAEVAATGADLRSPEALDGIAAGFQRWLSEGASDVGAQTRAVLHAAGRTPGTPGAALREAARAFTEAREQSAGNGSLMRTGVVALAHLGDAEAMAEAATAVGALTHPDPDCADACVLWCSGIRTAVLHGTFDGVREGLALLPAGRRERWATLLDEAEAHPPYHFSHNGWVVHALQAAWSAITRTPVPGPGDEQGRQPSAHLRLALEAAVRAGTDTDTVAAIAGALLGARWGRSAVPAEWRALVHGWPGLDADALIRLSVRTALGGRDETEGEEARPGTAGTDTGTGGEGTASPKDGAARTPAPFVERKDARSRVRGLLLGLALGDTLGSARGTLPAHDVLRAGVSTQLACFTAEGTIRALVRGEHKGVCHPPSVLWHAYCRWAALQGLETERMRERWASASAGQAWPDGWLSRVPALALRRGTAPATVAALSQDRQGSTDRPTTSSRGCHALTRTLPLAAVAAGKDPAYWTERAYEVAALTHGDRAAWSATAQAVVLLGHCLTSTPAEGLAFGPHGRGDHDGTQVREALREGLRLLEATASDPTRSPDPTRAPDPTSARAREALDAAFREAAEHPADARRLARLAPDATAPSALLGAVYVAASFPERARLGEALRFAAGAPDGDSVACVTGALLGAVHGAEALPVDLVARHELAWVLDTLAHDLVAQLADSPSGSEYVRGWDPHWWGRYPGW
ncbi:ADP-ribosylglycohydrolase family protein [Streptomyces jietaisiensis]|uniref:ADP-ribosylglycohydrolase family protein n=1 Tax=Streptomyces griseoaurantiacus TaxID=68213 RepID=UPI00324F2875